MTATDVEVLLDVAEQSSSQGRDRVEGGPHGIEGKGERTVIVDGKGGIDTSPGRNWSFILDVQ